MIKRVINH